MDSKKQIVDIFRNKGFKATPQRIVTTQTVLNSKNHPTAEEIYKKVQRACYIFTYFSNRFIYSCNYLCFS
jgi:Fe2+ or Zn2+ uptake regulation protein